MNFFNSNSPSSRLQELQWKPTNDGQLLLEFEGVLTVFWEAQRVRDDASFDKELCCLVAWELTESSLKMLGKNYVVVLGQGP